MSVGWIYTSYEKIVERPDQWHLDEAGYRLLEKVSWVVTEKIHGANFCFLVSEKVILCANRKHLLSERDDFFQYQVLLEKLRKNVQRVLTLTKKNFPEANRICIYGELFGGAYPHPDVLANPSLYPVQTGIYYSPEIEFCAFDLAIESDNHMSTRTYIDYEKAIDIFQEAELLYATPLFVVSYQEALDYPIGFQSTVPALLGLPPLQQDNKAEGIVIKPLKTIALQTQKGIVRPILKKKIAQFAEDKRFDQAQKWPTSQPIVAQSSLELLKWEAFNLVTENRLHNALSKLGAVIPSMPKRTRYLFRLLVEDILEQLSENQEEALRSLSEQERERLVKSIQEEVRTLFKKLF